MSKNRVKIGQWNPLITKETDLATGTQLGHSLFNHPVQSLSDKAYQKSEVLIP
jgi:hypothetical protein